MPVKKKNRKMRNISATCSSSLASAAQITFETYEIMDVLLNSLI
jgi:hypothetical protein